MSNRVWIELDEPRNAAHGEHLANQTTKMLKRLMPELHSYSFSWNDHRKSYFWGSSVAGYEELASRGKWFDVDILAGDE